MAPMDLGFVGDGPGFPKALRFPGDLSCLTLLALISSDAHALLGVGSASRKRCIFLGDSLGCSSSKLSLRKTQQRLCRHMSLEQGAPRPHSVLERGARAVLAGKRVPQAQQHHSMVMGASVCLLRPPTRATLEDEKNQRR